MTTQDENNDFAERPPELPLQAQVVEETEEPEAPQEEAGSFITEPSKLIRIASMTRAMLDEGVLPTEQPAYAAAVCTALGDTEAAFELLEKAYELRDPFLLSIRWYPDLNPDPDDPRLKNLLARLGLPWCPQGSGPGAPGSIVRAPQPNGGPNSGPA